jgi:four helix bundle protein
MSTALEVNSYRDLVAWQRGVDLVRAVYEQTKQLPADERYGLIAQMRRCAVSIPSNIAEGWGRHHSPDYIRFLCIARGSTFELCTQAEVCQRLEYDGDWSAIMGACEEIGRILNGLIASLKRHRAKLLTP